jgi:hypothetical protein
MVRALRTADENSYNRVLAIGGSYGFVGSWGGVANHPSPLKCQKHTQNSGFLLRARKFEIGAALALDGAREEIE